LPSFKQKKRKQHEKTKKRIGKKQNEKIVKEAFLP